MITLEIQKTALKTLPESPGIYFVMEDQKCLYVGKSKNLFNRWNSIKHHRENQIKADHPTDEEFENVSLEILSSDR